MNASDANSHREILLATAYTDARTIMLRNDLITLLAENENNAVTVCVNGAMVDVDSVAAQGGSIVLVLDPEGLRDALR